MGQQRFTREKVIARSREAIHLFINKQVDAFIQYLDESFVFIGDYDALFSHGIPEFISIISEERELPLAEITQEEYEVISHERRLWVSCGRYSVSQQTADASALFSRHHFTLVWRQTGDDLKLVHAMACHAKGYSPQNSEPIAKAIQARIFEESPCVPEATDSENKMAIRDITGKVRYVCSDEILYVKSDNKLCDINTKTETFTARIALNNFDFPQLILVQKSYLANIAYVEEICRYQLTLTNGTQIPVGKARYMGIKKILEESKGER